jgi:nucleotide-binding universal stress UspA family protein
MIKDILVHLDGGERDHANLVAALSLAETFDGRLTGLFARHERHALAMVARRASDAFAAAAQQSQQMFADTAKGATVPTRWWSVAHGETGHVLHETLAAARFHDLVVLGQHHDGKDAPEELAEHLLLQSGRPVLVLPAVGHYPTIGTNALVAWNGGREAARALHDAMPLLERAANVEVLTVRSQPPLRPDEMGLPPLSIHDHLAAHGITVSREVLAGNEIGVMDLLLSRAFDQGADLLVMGGHGGYHLPFFKGAGTRHILKHMTLPVFMSH